MKAKFFILIIAGLFTVSLACSSIDFKIKSSHDLEETTWGLDSLNGAKLTLALGKEITLEFDKKNGKIRGQSGCNKYFGDYIKDQNKLNFSNIGSTKMSCDDMLAENDFLNALPKIDKYDIYDKVLTLYVADRRVMVFHAKD